MTDPQISNRESMANLVPRKNDDNVVAFVLQSTVWEQKIVIFLRAHPRSSLLMLVLHLRPDFLKLPSARRAATWFWLKRRLCALQAQGVLASIEDADGVTVWSICSEAE